MKILFVQRFDIFTVSCAVRAINMARELVRLGHEVTLVNFPHRERQQSLARLHEKAPEGVRLLDLDRSGNQLLHNIQVLRKASRDMDLIHLWKCYPDAALPSIYAAYFNDLPLHYDWDDYEEGISEEFTGSRGVARLVRTYEYFLLRLADSITVASRQLRDLALERGAPAYRIWDAPVGADLDRFHPDCDGSAIRKEFGLRSPVLLYVGQLEVANFPEQCLGVLERVRQKKPDAMLLVVGGGKKLEALKQSARERGLEEIVRFTDYIPQARVPESIAAADVALAPFDDNIVTRSKSPLKIVEYLSSGCPVVAGDVGEARRMIGEAGRCVPPGDLDAMAQAVLEILEEPGGAAAWHSRARDRAARIYNWERTTRTLVEAYEFAVGERWRT